MTEDKAMKDVIVSTQSILKVQFEKTDISDHYYVYARVRTDLLV